jgi:DNA-binding GntR family transcriptional regulator
VRAKAELGIVDQLHKRGGKLDGSSERTLAKRLGTSRSTTRRALHALVAAGVVKIAAGTLLLTAA